MSENATWFATMMMRDAPTATLSSAQSTRRGTDQMVAPSGASARDGINKLPPELLAHCFLFLPHHLRDRLPILHVSRVWRTTALEFPTVWSDVVLHDGCRGAAQLLHLVLGHTAGHPVNLRFLSTDDGTLEGIYNVITEHVHHLRSIRWVCVRTSRGFQFTRFAPLLEHLHLDNLDALNPSFLDGCCGALRGLNAGKLTLPVACPALANLTSLRCTPAGDFSSLFLVCPRLERLSLVWIEAEDAIALLPLSPPPSLAHLHLHAGGYLCDIIALGRAWRTPYMRMIHLQVPSESSGDPSLLLDGMCELSVRTGRVSGLVNPHSVARVVARHPSGPDVQINIPRVSVRDAGTPIYRFLVVYLKQRAFARMRRLTLSADVLYPFSETVRDLPALEELHLILVQSPIGGARPAYTFDWELLEGITDLTRFHLSCIVVEVEYQPGEPPDAQDARDLVERLAKIWTDGTPSAGRAITRVEIKGFPASFAHVTTLIGDITISLTFI